MWERGTVLGGRYKLAKRIGGGAMGDVWRADDDVLERPVAVKILLPALLDDPAFASRFRREAKLMATLNHPCIVDIHDYGETTVGSGTTVAYIVMELIDGRPLDRVLAEQGPMAWERTLDIVAQALDGLHAAHRRSIVHRDLKPSNLMLREDGRVTVTDFGIARALAGTRITASHEVLGTALYVAPEQAEGIATVPASDLYSLGVVCYEMLVGDTPFTGESVLEVVLKHIREPAPELPAGFPQPVREFVARALAKLPEDRFRDAATMAAAARRITAGGPVGVDPVSPDPVAGGGVVFRGAAAGKAGGGEAAGGERSVFGGLVESGTAVGGPAGAVPVVGGLVETAGTQPVAPAPAPVPATRAELAPAAPAPVPVAPVPAPAPIAPDQGRTRWHRRRRLMPVIIPLVITVGVGTVVYIATVPFDSNAGASGPQSAGSGSAVAGSGSGYRSPSGSASGSASGGTGTSPTGSGTSGAPHQAGSGAGGGSGKSGGSGSSGTSPTSGGGTDTGTGGTSTGSGGTGTVPTTGPASAPTHAAPTTAPVAKSTTPAGCGGDGWGNLVNVGDGLKVGLSSDSLSGGTEVVMGGYTAYGWVYSTPDQWHAFNPCNLNDPSMGLEMGQQVELASGYGDVTSWTVDSAGSGSYYIENYLGTDCLTDNGAGRQLTVGTCTPGNASQKWLLP